ncbi:metalloendopeptidase [Cordyceps fumosorosea ARSEF 2679]|uniref:deuterolysin n=1 Tax=Cordyceps fumosorosea (strain ARSEF 2679) TaxID=1081104 RepID=A0A167Q4A7_CORFA|nr:metalloendopeptidase [Cordyceps fumosorosea ARSEF 2679]OAA57273.1 metalloendopeptidase [Cordyceps fumosorosea ARSEF 2679]
MKLLALLAPLALAATIPAESKEDWPAKLEVRAKLRGWTRLDVTIENKSPKAFNILKAGSILDENRLESMRLLGPNCEVTFLDRGSPDTKTAREESEFLLMPAHGSLNTTIDLLDVRNAYRFCGKNISFLSGSATLHAAELGNNTLARKFPYEFDNILVYHEFFPPLPEAFEERVHKCSPDYMKVLKEGIKNCASHATAAREAALTGSAERMEAYFKDSSQETRNSVADTFSKVAEMCDFKNPRIYITCNHEWCNHAMAAMMPRSDPGHMLFCRRAYFQPTLPDLNEISSVTHTIVHEMTHLAFVKATKDIKYGLYDSTKLDKDSSLNNADSYALFSDSVFLKEDGLNQTRADAERERIKNGYYDPQQLGNITRDEFLSLAPDVRAERFGFELK